MILISPGHPLRFRKPAHQKPSRAQHFLTDQHQHLTPDPSRQDRQPDKIHLCEKHVFGIAVEVEEGEETEDGLAGDKVPPERAAAVAVDVAVYLGDPEGEVEEGEGSEVEASGIWGPGGGI